MKVINFKNKANKTVGKLEIKNINGNSSIRFDGDIVDSDWDKWNDTDSCPSDVLEALNGLSGDLDIYINSGGGSVFSGMSIYNILNRYAGGTKTVYVDGLAGSIASVIAMAGDKIVMPKNSFLMIHKPLCMVGGNANDFRKMADTLDTIEQGIINVYATKLKDGANIDDIKSMVNNETWLTGEQAQQYFNIEVSEANNAIAFIRKNDFQNYLNDKLQEPKPVKNQKQQISTPTVEDKEQLELETELLKLELEL